MHDHRVFDPALRVHLIHDIDIWIEIFVYQFVIPRYEVFIDIFSRLIFETVTVICTVFAFCYDLYIGISSQPLCAQFIAGHLHTPLFFFHFSMLSYGHAFAFLHALHEFPLFVLLFLVLFDIHELIDHTRAGEIELLSGTIIGILHMGIKTLLKAYLKLSLIFNEDLLRFIFGGPL